MRILATLLHYANSQPPWQFKEEFYTLKKRLLLKYATPDGADVQHLPSKQCWTCDGTGIYDIWTSSDNITHVDYCDKCSGTGWYKSPRWVCLNRYRWGKYVFHMPGEVSYTKPEPDITKIVGYVKHRDYGECSEEAFAWLCLLCGEWRLFWRWLNSSFHMSFQWWPWLSVQWAIGEVSCYRERLSRKCVKCGGRVGLKASWRCDACDAAYESVASEEDMPF